MTTQQQPTRAEEAVERMDASLASEYYAMAANSVDVDEDEMVDDDLDDVLFDETEDPDFDDDLDDDWED